LPFASCGRSTPSVRPSARGFGLASPDRLRLTRVALTVPRCPLWVHFVADEEWSQIASSGRFPAPPIASARRIAIEYGAWPRRSLCDGSPPDIFQLLQAPLRSRKHPRRCDSAMLALWGFVIDRITSSIYRAALAVAEKFCTSRRKPPIQPTGQSATVLSACAADLGDQRLARSAVPLACWVNSVARRSHISVFIRQRLLAHSHHSLILWLQDLLRQAMLTLMPLVDPRASDHPVSLGARPASHLPRSRFIVAIGLMAERYVKAHGIFPASNALELWNLRSMFLKACCGQARRDWHRFERSAHRVQPRPPSSERFLSSFTLYFSRDCDGPRS